MTSGKYLESRLSHLAMSGCLNLERTSLMTAGNIIVEFYFLDILMMFCSNCATEFIHDFICVVFACREMFLICFVLVISLCDQS